MSTVHFISFGDDKFNSAKERILKQAQNSGLFVSSLVYGEPDLKGDFQHSSFCYGNSRGFGYWIWKLYITIKRLKEISAGEFLLYADAGCIITGEGREKLAEHISMINGISNDFDLLCFDLGYPEEMWTKEDVLSYFNVSQDTRKSGMIAATTYLIRKTTRVLNFLENIYKIISENRQLLTDACILPNSPIFRDHRHDQSVWSVALKELYTNKCVIFDQTYPYQGKTWADLRSMYVQAQRSRTS